MGNETRTFIEARAVTRRFQGRTVVDRLSFAIGEGEIVGFVGPNGAGKTTTVRLLTGVLRADEGTLRVGGFDPSAEGERVRALSGVLTESASFYGHLSGRENLRFFAELAGGEAPARVEGLLELVGLLPHAERAAGTYSTGMRKRLGLARALLPRPKVLFLDEPTNGLDPEGIRDVLALIGRLNREEGTTILVCSHLLQQLEAVCHRYLFVEQGRLVEQGTLSELEARYRPQDVVLQVETPWLPEGGRVQGFLARQAAAGRLEITLPGRDAVPALLSHLTQRAPVYGAALQEQSLEQLYFRIQEHSRHA